MTGRFSEKSFDSRPMNIKVVTKKRRVERHQRVVVYGC